MRVPPQLRACTSHAAKWANANMSGPIFLHIGLSGGILEETQFFENFCPAPKNCHAPDRPHKTEGLAPSMLSVMIL